MASMINPISNEGIYSNWSGTIWDYGDDSQYPRLVRIKLRTLVASLGSKDNPYKIRTREELINITNMTGYYEIENEIDLTGTEWEPINIFGGEIDGKGNKIKGMKINKGTEELVGMFKGITGTIRNLIIENAEVKGKKYVGILAGGLSGGKIENVYITGTVEGKENVVGGIVGFNWQGGKIERSYYRGRIKAEKSFYVGGISGYQVGEESEIKEVKTEIKIEGFGYIGGIVGKSIRGKIEDIISEGEIKGVREIGGVVGIGENVIIKRGYTEVEIEGWEGYALGGIVGEMTGTIERVYYNKEEAGERREGEEGKTEREIKEIEETEWGTIKWEYGTREERPRIKEIIKIMAGKIKEVEYEISSGSIRIRWQEARNKEELGREIKGYRIYVDGSVINETGTEVEIVGLENEKVYEIEIRAYTEQIEGEKEIEEKLIIERSKQIQEGVGSEVNPYRIRTEEHLNSVRNDLEGNYIIMGTIEMTREMESIGGKKGFRGEINGRGNKIIGMKIRKEKGRNVGIFGKTKGARIGSMWIEAEIEGKRNVGGIVGKGYGGEIKEIRIEGTVKGKRYVGGIIGRAREVKIEDVEVWNGIILVEKNVIRKVMGGVIGKGVKGTIKNVIRMGNIEEEIKYATYWWQLVGCIIGVDEGVEKEGVVCRKEDETTSQVGITSNIRTFSFQVQEIYERSKVEIERENRNEGIFQGWSRSIWEFGEGIPKLKIIEDPEIKEIKEERDIETYEIKEEKTEQEIREELRGVKNKRVWGVRIEGKISSRIKRIIKEERIGVVIEYRIRREIKDFTREENKRKVKEEFREYVEGLGKEFRRNIKGWEITKENKEEIVGGENEIYKKIFMIGMFKRGYKENRKEYNKLVEELKDILKKERVEMIRLDKID